MIYEAGRVVIPKSLREELRLSPGDLLELKRHGDKITNRPVRGTLQKEDGVWVFRTGVRLTASTTDESIDDTRGSRDLESIGRKA